MSVQLPRRGDKIFVPQVGLCTVKRILPNGEVEAAVDWSQSKVRVRLVTSWEVVKVS